MMEMIKTIEIDIIYSWIQQYLVNNIEIYIRILVSAIIGFIIGWDREAKSKPAGLKTYMYVAVASTLITIISIYSVDKFDTLSVNNRTDPMRLAAQIVSGLGFLGAGVILKDGLRVKGLTSAAMILFAGGVGIGIGAGFYEYVLFAVLTCLIMARIGNRLEASKYKQSQRKLIEENTSENHEC